jgi:hypothetical protein
MPERRIFFKKAGLCQFVILLFQRLKPIIPRSNPQMGVKTFLPKPYTAEKLLKTVATVLKEE